MKNKINNISQIYIKKLQKMVNKLTLIGFLSTYKIADKFFAIDNKILIKIYILHSPIYV